MKVLRFFFWLVYNENKIFLFSFSEIGPKFKKMFSFLG
jgi:hypothetical protein